MRQRPVISTAVYYATSARNNVATCRVCCRLIADAAAIQPRRLVARRSHSSSDRGLCLGPGAAASNVALPPACISAQLFYTNINRTALHCWPPKLTVPWKPGKPGDIITAPSVTKYSPLKYFVNKSSAVAEIGMDTSDATWYGGRPRPRPHCARWGPARAPRKGTEPPILYSTLFTIYYIRQQLKKTRAQ